MSGKRSVDGGWTPLPTRPQRYCDPASLVQRATANFRLITTILVIVTTLSLQLIMLLMVEIYLESKIFLEGYQKGFPGVVTECWISGRSEE